MKKLSIVLVLSIVTTGLKADLLGDINKTVSSGNLQNVSRQLQKEAKKYEPAIKKLAVDYRPMAQEVVSKGQELLGTIPADQRKALIMQAQNVIKQAAAVAEAQKGTALNKAQDLLKQHTNELNTIKQRVVNTINNNPAAVAAVERYVNEVKNVDQVRNALEEAKMMIKTPFGR